MSDIPKGLCRCGCGRKTQIASENRPERGYVRGEPRPYVRGHHSIPDRYIPLEPRLLDAIDFTRGDCWVWTKGKGSHGYGCISVLGKQTLAHRATYELLVGPVPSGLDLDHLCRNTMCVNPAHLEPVTHAENIRRGFEAKARAGSC